MTLGERVQAIIDDLDKGCTTEETRADAEALLGDLQVMGIDGFGITYTDDGPVEADAGPAEGGVLETAP